MLEKELEELVGKVQSFNSEFSNLEVNEAHMDCPKKLYDTISAFFNGLRGSTDVLRKRHPGESGPRTLEGDRR